MMDAEDIFEFYHEDGHSNAPDEMKTFKVKVILYHTFEVEAKNEADAREELVHVQWDDHVKDCIIEVEENEHHVTL